MLFPFLLPLLRKLLPLALFAPLAAVAAEVKVADNVYVVPDPDAPTTTVWMIVGAGCKDEAGRCHGVAHYLEHLIFLGRSPDHNVIAARFFPDAETNGLTDHRTTHFWQRFPRHDDPLADLDKVIRFYAKQLSELDVSVEQAERERRVVMQEWAASYGRGPVRRFYDRLQAALYPGHPLGVEMLGTQEEIAAFTLAEARAFHDAFYVPEKVSFIVRGPFTPEAVAAIAHKWLDPLPRRPAPALSARLDLTPAALTVDMQDPQAGQRLVAYVACARIAEPDRRRAREARGLLVDYLASTLPGSVYDVLVNESGLARSVYTAIHAPAPGVAYLEVSVEPADGASAPEIAARLRHALEALARDGMSQATLDRLRARAENVWTARDADPEQSAQALLGWFRELGDYESWQARRASLAAVTTADISALAAALAHPDRSVVGSLSP